VQGAMPPELIGRQASGRSVWFCGPAGWGETLADWLRRAGVPTGSFHREYFEFR
jgi:predicted ferric reductase